MTWAIVIMVGLFVILRAMRQAAGGGSKSALERAVATAFEPQLEDDDEEGGEDAAAPPALVSAPAGTRNTASAAFLATPRNVTNPRTRAILRTINGKGLCSPRGD